MNIVQRDLKLENVLIDPSTGNVKIIDFGFSLQVNQADERKFPFTCGTPHYLAPELAQRQLHLAKPTDMWALGVLYFALLTGKMPFHSGYENELYRLIMQGRYQYPVNLTNYISKDAKRVIALLLNITPTKRMTAKQLIADPYLKV